MSDSLPIIEVNSPPSTVEMQMPIIILQNNINQDTILHSTIYTEPMEL